MAPRFFFKPLCAQHRFRDTSIFFDRSFVAQRKRAGPITQRTVDRNNPKLFFFPSNSAPTLSAYPPAR